jgi:hypothetical protein
LNIDTIARDFGATSILVFQTSKCAAQWTRGLLRTDHIK